MALVAYFEKQLLFDDFNEYQMLLLSQTVKLRFFRSRTLMLCIALQSLKVRCSTRIVRTKITKKALYLHILFDVDNKLCAKLVRYRTYCTNLALLGSTS